MDNDGKVKSVIPRIAKKMFWDAMVEAANKGGYTVADATAILFHYVAQAYYYGENVEPERFLYILERGKTKLA